MMDYSGMHNIVEKTKTIKGGDTKAGTIVFGIIGILMLVIGISGLPGDDFTEVVRSLILTGAGLILAIASFTSFPRDKNAVRTSWAKLSPEEINRIEMQAISAPIVGTAFVTPDAVVKKTQQGPCAIPSKDIIWIYGGETTHKYWGLFATGKSFSITIVDREGKEHIISNQNAKMRDNQAVDYQTGQIRMIYDILSPQYPGIIFGYSEEVAAMTRSNISRLVEIVDARNQGGHTR